MKKSFFSLAVLILGIFLIVNLIRGIFDAYKSKKKLSDAKEKLVDLKSENERLKNDLEFSKSEFFIEKEARDKLNLGKEGELTVVLPQVTLDEVKTKEKAIPNWQRWYKLFF